MTTLKKLSYLLAVSSLIFACVDDDIDPPIVEVENDSTRTSQYFEANVEMQKISAFPVDYSPVLLLKVTYTGSGTSNMISNVSLKASHLEEVPSGSGISEITNGQFVLNDGSGNEIFGTYSGQRNGKTIDWEYTWVFQIQGGAGEFAEAQGTLTVLVTNLSRGGDGSPLKAKITGNVGLPIQTQ